MPIRRLPPLPGTSRAGVADDGDLIAVDEKLRREGLKGSLLKTNFELVLISIS